MEKFEEQLSKGLHHFLLSMKEVDGRHSKIEDLYAYIRDKRGYDALDEYIREEVLKRMGYRMTKM